jgi:hypothetical protein
MPTPIAARNGQTILRLTQSGFDSSAEWHQEYYDSANYGWKFRLANLRAYLELHAGQIRRVAWSRHTVEKSRDRIYAKLIEPAGLLWMVFLRA